ncbi:hypothetical protein PR003_g13956 [Phytophthora rubi]|uniref:Uncharacterized protein n=1 Tax=Phytophthora rubi TaxID=129364 RepID=A0A6A3LG76_9STRA|nr:hypothetical protein PR002_g13503 [Phytophthora rubi]KAE9021503.1 hypothetical protein PR001_g13352 [Phytophthora rubi]KAE9333572.1 hypothetical protein PR003_g13956 [Phytophthora rubi]
MKHECESCCALRKELVQLQEASELRATQDHDQCVAMFQQMQELVRLNEAVARGRNRSESRVSIGEVEELDRPDVEVEKSATQVQRLQAIVVQQAKEIETLRRRQRDVIADGRVGLGTADRVGNQVDDQILLRSTLVEDTGATDTGSDDDEDRDEAHYRPAAKKHASQLRKLPLSSLHAQLKGKELKLLHCQQLIAKLEARLEQLIDRKRSMAQSYQHTTRTQQAHLKKYLAYIRQQTTEKKALERQVRELKQYVDVLEKKVVNSLQVSSRNGHEITSTILSDAI